MARARRRFGPLFYLTAIVALIAVASMPFWKTGIQQYRAWRLSRQLHDAAVEVRREAADGLVQLGPAATWWVIRATRDPDPQVRLISCSILGRSADINAIRPIEALIASTKDSDPAVRAGALEQLGPLIVRYGALPEGELRERMLRSLCTALDDASPQVRQAAGWALWNLGPMARPAIGDLNRALNGADKSLRILAADALLRIDPTTARPGVSASLQPLLTDQSIRLDHWRLVQVLVRAQGEEATVAMLAPLLHHADLGTRLQAINDLTAHCTGAESLKPLLIKQLSSDDEALRDEAAIYLLKHEPTLASRAIDILADQMADPRAGSYFPAQLVKDVKLSSPESLTPLARGLVERLSRANNPQTRLNAIMALGEIGPQAALAVRTLLDATRSDDQEIAVRAIEALVKVDRQAAASRIPSLMDWMTPGHKTAIRLNAMAALRDLGPAAKVAISALLKLADEDDLPISTGALEAISRIDPATGTALKQAIERGAPRTRDD